MAIGSPQWMYASGEAYTIDQSLKFDDNRECSLTFTPTNSQTNDKIGTWSFWTKKTEVIDDNEVVLFSSRNSAGTIDHITIGFHYDDYENNLIFLMYESSQLVSQMIPKNQFRDPSAWYHVVIAVDTTQSTASDRVNIYINGDQVTEWEEENYPAQNKRLKRWASQESPINIGRTGRTSNHSYYDGYLSEVHYIDGQQKQASDFGETGDYGEWKPVEYSGTYGNNGFYLPFKQDYTVEGFSTVTYKGTNADQYIGGTGFKPNLTWLKRRDSSAGHMLYDSIRGVGKSLSTQSTGAENVSDGGDDLTAFNTDGFSLGPVHQGNSTNVSGGSIVAWNWDMGADTPTGFGAVAYKGNGGSQDLSLGFEPDLVWIKKRTAQEYHVMFDTVRGLGDGKALYPNATQQEGLYKYGNVSKTHPDGFSLATGTSGIGYVNDSSNDYIAWGWDMGGSNASNTTGDINSTVRANTTYGQSIVSFTGTGSSSTVGHGLSSAPEVVLVMNRDVIHNPSMWHTGIANTKYLHLDGTAAEATNTAYWNSTSPTNQVFTVGTSADVNGNGNNMIAYCFHSVSGYSKFGTYSGSGGSGNAQTLGFRPAFLMVKRTDSTSDWAILDSTRAPLNPVDKALRGNGTNAEDDLSTNYQIDFTDTGFSFSNYGYNETGSTYIYMAFAGGIDSVSTYNTDGSSDSRVKANTTYGQSIVTYKGQSGAQTIGHGLDSAPEVIIVKNRDNADEWRVYHASTPAGGSYNAEQYSLRLDTADSEADSTYWNDTSPTSSVFSVGDTQTVNSGHGNDYVAYCWHSVTGYSKFNRFTGTGSATAINVDCGFAPAMVILKVADASSNRDWHIFDNVRGNDKYLRPNTSGAETTDSTPDFSFTSTGFSITTTNDEINSNGDATLYMAFADKREYAYWLDQSGNNNDWTSNNLTESDISLDSPSNNFCTMNPLSPNKTNLTFSEGNLKLAGWDTGFFGTMGVSSGKWYWEMHSTNASGNANNTSAVGIVHSDALHDTVDGSSNSGFNDYGGTNKARGYYGYDGNKLGASSSASYGDAFVTGDIIGVALNLDDGEITFYKNNVSQGVAFTSLGSGEWFPLWQNWTGSVGVMNFGQDSSFSGIKSAQGNQDSNDIGDFYYEPPTGFLALCTDNLPEPAVTPSENFNTVLYTGNGSTNAITGVGFQPDFLWLKKRGSTGHHFAFDSVRGAGKQLKPSTTGAETSHANYLASFDTNGFTLGSDSDTNANATTHVAWNWKAGTSVSGSTTGSGTAQSYTGSVNSDAGFSIIKYTGNGTDGMQVPHHLGVVPDVILIKSLTVQAWNIFFPNALGADKGLQLNNTGAQDGPFYSTHLSDTMPTTSLVTLGNGAMTNTFADGVGQDYIMYCWANKEGYVKAGKYTGNQNADGTFVYTGFRVAFVLIKNTATAGEGFVIMNNKSDPANPIGTYLTVYQTNAEQGTPFTTSSRSIDFVSNGFKIRGNSTEINESGDEHVYLAFAETPFKYSNGR